MTTGFALFGTPVGRCGLAWTAAGISALSLPERDHAATRKRLLRRDPGLPEADPPASVAAAITRIVGLLEGEHDPLDDVALDLGDTPDFDRAVYAILQRTPPGRTTTYGEIATALGDRALSRRVGQALGRNPIPVIIPCHRVLGSHGTVGGFSAPGGRETKMRLLSIEKAELSSDEPGLFESLPLALAPETRDRR